MTLSNSAKFTPPEPEAQYQALRRSLQRRKGFGIKFIQCAPAEATRLIDRLQTDLPQKHIAVLRLDQAIDNLFQLVAQRPDRDELNILFIQGIEKSLEAYIKPGYGGQGDYYQLDTVPTILNHLNQQRENFRDCFPRICFVFIVPLFALKYFMLRAQDFFDWQSGVYKFSLDEEVVEDQLRPILAFPPSSQEFNIVWHQLADQLHTLIVFSQKDYDRLTPPERQQKILELEQLLASNAQTDRRKATLLFLQGLLFGTENQYEEAIARHNQSLALNPNYPEAWLHRGRMLAALNRNDEAIASYNQALDRNSAYAEALLHRGHAQRELGRDQAATTDYHAALAIKPNYGDALLALFSIEHHDQATEPLNIAQMLFNQLRRSTNAPEPSCQVIADRLATEIQQLCAEDKLAAGIDPRARAVALAKDRLKEYLHYYHLGSNEGRVELHSTLAALVYPYLVPPPKRQSALALPQIEDFLQEFYLETLQAFRQAAALPSTYQPRSMLELAEYMAFTERYAKRPIVYDEGREQLFIVMRAKAFAI
jgi:tetratricopeptide (TPR) repeat protein